MQRHRGIHPHRNSNRREHLRLRGPFFLLLGHPPRHGRRLPLCHERNQHEPHAGLRLQKDVPLPRAPGLPRRHGGPLHRDSRVLRRGRGLSDDHCGRLCHRRLRLHAGRGRLHLVRRRFPRIPRGVFGPPGDPSRRQSKNPAGRYRVSVDRALHPVLLAHLPLLLLPRRCIHRPRHHGNSGVHGAAEQEHRDEQDGENGGGRGHSHDHSHGYLHPRLRGDFPCCRSGGRVLRRHEPAVSLDPVGSCDRVHGHRLPDHACLVQGIPRGGCE
mmetsp:Transcript_5210/g.10307  ORF Transcript_5210/g.10307 Transcript_5210/m.10307 type:complete len:270 (+) Transcript_5210:773-1582(+)